eukprot:CAMPEP_0179406774 /NCGR_PEP_ID=MMETSP0799-20121207/1102_1 /TAXON_ID=46947 /ORGANISM="Geminigera cryophila, Strain CCMP2564" /LENGTH=83 /DNA_ID=CAMNT_0021177917 /DNA_START=396 /DNA_END=644 /DNA_ORIENTATION=+
MDYAPYHLISMHARGLPPLLALHPAHHMTTPQGARDLRMTCTLAETGCSEDDIYSKTSPKGLLPPGLPLDSRRNTFLAQPQPW